MDDAVERFLERFQESFGTAFMITKIHSMLHFGRELHRHKMLISCFAHERKHYLVELIVSEFPITQL
jgi:hypothetical protein